MNGQAAARIAETELAREAAPAPQDAAGWSAAPAVKRCVDIVAALCLLVVSAPLCGVVALAIKLEDGGPVLYRQTRVGRRGTLFTLRKLRSMCPDAEADGGPQCATVDDPRVTRVGRWIRALRIDEIPQAWNVLVGEMSFVGPRPERPEFVATLRQTIPHYEQRHAVRPGLTGWAQVNQSYTDSVRHPEIKQRYDLYYLDHLSARFDVLILARTIRILLLGWGSR